MHFSSSFYIFFNAFIIHNYLFLFNLSHKEILMEGKNPFLKAACLLLNIKRKKTMHSMLMLSTTSASIERNINY